MRVRPKAPRRFTIGDLEVALQFHGARVRRIQLWRRANRGRPGVWMHLGRLRPRPDLLGRIQELFGGGRYRAKLLGPWLPQRGRELFLQQLTFDVSGYPTPRIVQRLVALGYRTSP